MRRILSLAAFSAVVLGGSALFAQVVNPDINGPVRRGVAGAADALGADGVERRMERRDDRQDFRQDVRRNQWGGATINFPDPWRYSYHNNEWWYYTPQNSWMYYRDNNWSNYDRSNWAPAVPRYTTGYRGPYDNNRYYYNNNRRRGYNRGGYGYTAPAPYNNGTRAGNFGAKIGADIGAAAGTNESVRTGAAVGGAIGGAVGAARRAVDNVVPPVPAPAPVPLGDD